MADRTYGRPELEQVVSGLGLRNLYAFTHPTPCATWTSFRPEGGACAHLEERLRRHVPVLHGGAGPVPCLPTARSAAISRCAPSRRVGCMSAGPSRRRFCRRSRRASSSTTSARSHPCGNCRDDPGKGDSQPAGRVRLGAAVSRTQRCRRNRGRDEFRFLHYAGGERSAETKIIPTPVLPPAASPDEREADLLIAVGARVPFAREPAATQRELRRQLGTRPLLPWSCTPAAIPGRLVRRTAAPRCLHPARPRTAGPQRVRGLQEPRAVGDLAVTSTLSKIGAAPVEGSGRGAVWRCIARPREREHAARTAKPPVEIAARSGPCPRFPPAAPRGRQFCVVVFGAAVVAFGAVASLASRMPGSDSRTSFGT